MGQKSKIRIGNRVTCRYRGAHVGTVLAVNDPRAWEGSIAFSDVSGLPSQAAVDAHLAHPIIAASMAMHPSVPVAWDFGRVYWCKPTDLALAGEEVAHVAA